MDNNNEFKDRATRLAVTITLFGGAWFILQEGSKIWYKLFSESAYTKTIFNLEHVIAISIMTVIIAMMLSVIKYIYFETKSFISYDEIDLQVRALKRADEGFKDIFKNLKYSFNIIIFIFLILMITEFSEDVSFWKWILGAFSIVILASIFIIRINNNARDKLVNLTNVLESKINKYIPYSFFAYIAFLLFLCGMSITLVSFGQEKSAKVKFNNTKQMPVELEINNIDKIKIQVRINRDADPNNKINIQAKEIESYGSSIEVFKGKNSELHTLDIDKIKEELDNNNYKISIKNSKYKNKYKINLEKYILDGKSKIELLIQTPTDNIFIVNEFYKNGDKVSVKEKEFKVKL
ncbi:hypothetical protein [Bacillus thuringiensis]|uniref:hypothetical protein n=1 Tax=Bacillus thuringiensis TaxID=1428 RepID=UPI000BF4AA3B|nr:hypothetical protein [Bacillus thuringiensis]PFV41100.1 hypothetical protein COL03_18825 [Bacillus thuringiensis]